jgi:hypothetical protein
MKAILRKATFSDPNLRVKSNNYYFNFYGEDDEGILEFDSNRFLYDNGVESANDYDFEIEIKIKAIKKQSYETILG